MPNWRLRDRPGAEAPGPIMLQRPGRDFPARQLEDNQHERGRQ